ncbi:AraC family transcriptional regulator [Lentzea atacamensis]|uniref:AraC family transcriptional regulator n=2 Tax=Lentzea atacamensis TaxID=531938 RepID=A0ABX9ED30_9PSEU|nr:AraC family transcriptional regulator [Lentzea atacamensis]
MLMPEPQTGHDRGTADPDRNTALAAALDRLSLEGAIFFRSEFTECWAYRSLTPEGMAETLHPGARRLIIFHIVAAGRCWVSPHGGERRWADRGDVIVLPYGDQHEMGGLQEAEVVPIETLFEPPPWDSLPIVRHGEGGDRTDIVCGYLHSGDPLFDPGLRAFPPVFVVRPPEGPMAQWVRSSIDYAVAVSENSLPTGSIPTQLPELLLVEAVRLHLASAPAADNGWIAAIRDPVLAPALAQLHARPGHKWTVAELASSAAVSRSLLDERFRKVLGRSPIRYLTDWRMHLATGLLATTDHGVAVIARRVGYDAEEAFSRAFKRATGSSPGTWRAAKTAVAREL